MSVLSHHVALSDLLKDPPNAELVRKAELPNAELKVWNPADNISTVLEAPSFPVEIAS
jgi:hypothetical protein